MLNIARNSMLALVGLAASTLAPAVDSGRIGSASISELQTLVNEGARSTGAVGAQVSVIVGDQRADFVYGLANAELNAPMTVDTVVQLGSTTKVVNAAMVMTLVDEGKLSLDTPVVKYIPDLKLGDRNAQETLTLRRLLSMSSGLDLGPFTDFRGENALGRYIATLNNLPLTYPTGHGFGYSNASPCIEAYTAEKVTGLPWDTLYKKRIFEPAGITHAANLPTDLLYLRVAVGHAPGKDGPAKVLRPWMAAESLGPAGLTLAMSAHDLATFGQLFINGGKAANGTRVLSEAAVKTMMTPTTDVPIDALQWGVGHKWGLGPTMAKWGDTVVWGHGGSTLGGASQLLWFPDKHAVVTFTVDTPSVFEGSSLRLGDITQALLGVRAPTVTIPTTPVRVEHPERLVGNYVRTGVRYQITDEAGHLHYREFNEEMTGAIYKSMSQGTGKQPTRAASGATVDSVLTPLGDDKFMIDYPGFAHGIEVAFFNKDARGRAANINSGLRTGRRVE